jgi:hypothetical protein
MWEILIFKWFLLLKIQIKFKKSGFGRKNQLRTWSHLGQWHRSHYWFYNQGLQNVKRTRSWMGHRPCSACGCGGKLLTPSICYLIFTLNKWYTQPWGEGGGPRLSLLLSLSFFLPWKVCKDKTLVGWLTQNSQMDQVQDIQPVNNPPTFQCRTPRLPSSYSNSC